MASSQSTKPVIAFDLFGTLLSTESVAKELGKCFGEDKAATLAAQWRRYQLEYSWRITCMGIYRSFSDLTRAALKHAVSEQGLTLTDDTAKSLMEAYNGLGVFPEIPRALDTLRKRKDEVEAFIFSNGTDAMVTASLRTSPELAPYADLFPPPAGLVTVEAVQAFKPASSTYEHLLERAARQGQPGAVWVVTANPFDALGCRAAGLNSAWVDRAGRGWVDSLGDLVGLEPTLVVKGVDEAVEKILGREA